MKKKETEKFYDELSADYDSMIGFDSSLIKRTEALSSFIQPLDRNAVDLGCGSGLDSIALAKLGLDVTGFDISESMVKTASANASRLGINAEFLAYPVKKIPNSFKEKFSFAVSLGNALANINEKELALSLKKIYSLLKPGGHALVQILNYNRILKEKNRIVGVTEKGAATYIRFYDFYGENTFFNILKIERGEKTTRSLITTEIFPYKKKKLTGMIKDAGFSKVKIFGGLNKGEYKEGLSQDLVITALKD